MHAVHAQLDGLHQAALPSLRPHDGGAGGGGTRHTGTPGPGEGTNGASGRIPSWTCRSSPRRRGRPRPHRARLQPVERRPDARRRAQRCPGPVTRAGGRRARSHRPAAGALHRRPVPRRPDAALPRSAPSSSARAAGSAWSTPSSSRTASRSRARAGCSSCRASRRPVRCGSPRCDLRPATARARAGLRPAAGAAVQQRADRLVDLVRRAPERRPQDDLADRRCR